MPSIQAKVETAFNHAFTFYKQNGRSVESQESCIQQIAQMTGFDRATCIEIQAPVLSILMYNDTMDIANQVIQQHLNTVTGIIRGRLLDSNHSNVQSISQSLAPALKHLTPDEWSLGMHTTSLSGRKSKDTDGISNQAKGCFDYIKHNGSVSIDKLRLFTLRDSDLTEIDMVYFSNEMAPYSARFNYLDFSYNRVNDSGISCLFKHAFVPTGTYAKHVVSLNLSNNNLGNDSAIIISNAIANGQLPATRSIDISGNKITEVGDGYLVEAIQGAKVLGGVIIVTHKVEWAETGPMLQFAKNIRGPFNETVDTIYDGAKKQGTLAFGTKEAKQAIIEGWLESAQSKGVDTKNVVVSKDIFEAVLNYGKLKLNFSLGWVKCSVVPKDVKSFAADKILATASPEAGTIKTVIDTTLCYFESFDESMTSQRGVQFLGDLGLLPQGDFVDAVE
jgi:hypothetical protein